MTKEQALATGELGELGADDPAEPTACAWYGLADQKRDDRWANWAVAISKKFGVVSIRDLGGLRTHEGIAVGSTLDRVNAAYPGLKHYYNSAHFAPVPGNTAARYRFEIKEGR